MGKKLICWIVRPEEHGDPHYHMPLVFPRLYESPSAKNILHREEHQSINSAAAVPACDAPSELAQHCGKSAALLLTRAYDISVKAALSEHEPFIFVLLSFLF